MVTSPTRQTAEHRKHPRQALHYPAWIVLGADQAPYKVMLSDVSRSGAKISLAGHLEIPEEFVLLLSEEGRTRRNCRAVWRDNNCMGVEFLRGSLAQDDMDEANP